MPPPTWRVQKLDQVRITPQFQVVRSVTISLRMVAGESFPPDSFGLRSPVDVAPQVRQGQVTDQERLAVCGDEVLVVEPDAVEGPLLGRAPAVGLQVTVAERAEGSAWLPA